MKTVKLYDHYGLLCFVPIHHIVRWKRYSPGGGVRIFLTDGSEMMDLDHSPEEFAEKIREIEGQ